MGRLELLPFGNFDDYVEGNCERQSEPRLSLGVGYAFADNAPRIRGILGSTPTDGGTSDYHVVTADAVFMMGGFSFHTESILRTGRRNPGDLVDESGQAMPVEGARNGIGWFAQAGYLLPNVDLEISARYGLLRAIGADSSMPQRNELGAGIGYYILGHGTKVQLDAFRLWDESMTQGGDTRVRLSFQATL